MVRQSTVADLYRRVVRPFGRRQVDEMAAQGLPLALVPPLKFLIESRLSLEDQRIVDLVESLRSAVAIRHETFDVIFPTHGASRGATRTAEEIARTSSIASTWGTFLYLCVKAFKPRTVLELGSAAGISGAYLAAGPSVEHLITVEGSPALAQLAEHNIRQVSARAEILNCRFDEALDRLPEIMRSVDFAFIDGQHTRSARHHYMRRIVPCLRPGSVVVFDDIHLSEELWEAWHELRRWPGVSHAVNTGRLGVCLWDGGAVSPRYYDLSAMTGCLRVGGRRWKWREERRFCS